MGKFEKQDVVTFLIEKIATQVKIEKSEVRPQVDLHEIGLSSLDAVLISGEMEDEFGVEIDPIIMFECKTIEEVAEKVLQLNGE